MASPDASETSFTDQKMDMTLDDIIKMSRRQTKQRLIKSAKDQKRVGFSRQASCLRPVISRLSFRKQGMFKPWNSNSRSMVASSRSLQKRNRRSRNRRFKSGIGLRSVPRSEQPRGMQGRKWTMIRAASNSAHWHPKLQAPRNHLYL